MLNTPPKVVVELNGDLSRKIIITRLFTNLPKEDVMIIDYSNEESIVTFLDVQIAESTKGMDCIYVHEDEENGTWD